MKPIFVRDARPEDAEQCLDWITRIADKNLFDPQIFGYPAPPMRTLVAYRPDEGALLFVPLQTVYVLESLAPKPGTEGLTEAAALKEIVQDVVSTSQRTGVREIIFLCRDQRVIEFAQHYGFELSTLPLLRMRLT